MSSEQVNFVNFTELQQGIQNVTMKRGEARWRLKCVKNFCVINDINLQEGNFTKHEGEAFFVPECNAFYLANTKKSDEEGDGRGRRRWTR